MLHGQGRGGVDRPGPSILTDGLWWEWVLATRAWPPHHGHELVFGKAADSLGEWAAALREPAAGTANEVGDILAALKSELGL